MTSATDTTWDFKIPPMDAFAQVTFIDRGSYGPSAGDYPEGIIGRSCFVEFVDTPAAKAAVVDLLLAGITFTLAGLFEMEGGGTEVWFLLHTIDHDTYLTPKGDDMEDAFRSYCTSLGGTYTGS